MSPKRRGRFQKIEGAAEVSLDERRGWVAKRSGGQRSWCKRERKRSESIDKAGLSYGDAWRAVTTE